MKRGKQKFWIQHITCAAVERQLSGGVKFLDEELGQRYPVVRVQGLIAFFPVEHQVVVCVSVWGGETERKLFSLLSSFPPASHHPFQRAGKNDPWWWWSHGSTVDKWNWKGGISDATLGKSRLTNSADAWTCAATTGNGGVHFQVITEQNVTQLRQNNRVDSGVCSWQI